MADQSFVLGTEDYLMSCLSKALGPAHKFKRISAVPDDVLIAWSGNLDAS